MMAVFVTVPEWMWRPSERIAAPGMSAKSGRGRSLADVSNGGRDGGRQIAERVAIAKL